MKQKYLIKKRQDNKPHFVHFILNGPVLTREHGIVGGVVHGSHHTYEGLNLGKINEKTPEQVAEEDYLRLIKTKTKEGYQETKNLDDLVCLDQPTDLNLDNIPESFCISKPIKTISTGAIDALLEKGVGKFFIKYNGIGHFILIRSDGEIKIYTRRWCDHTIKYPEIVNEIKTQGYSKNTLLYAEFSIDPTLKIPHMTAFLLMSQISKADVAEGVCKTEVPKSLALQKKHRVRAALLYILYYDNEPVYQHSFNKHFNSFLVLSSYLSDNKAVFVPKELSISSGKAAKQLVKENKHIIEGLVLVDTTANIEITMNGKPNRCASWKIKATGDIDVIAYGYVSGRGKNQGKIGALKICQYDSKGNKVALGTVGGLTDSDRDPDSWKFPCVIEVKYDQRFPETGKFQFGRFSKRHEDKTPEEVEKFNLDCI